MADSNTTNPFNPNPEGENPPPSEGTQPASAPGQDPKGTGQTPPPMAPSEKLKLKKTTRILTPLYARPKETPSIGKKKLKIQVPHAVAIDPEPEPKPEISTTSVREEIGNASGEGIPPPILPPTEGQAPVPPPEAIPAPQEIDPEGVGNKEEPSESKEEPQEKIQTLVASDPKRSSKRFLTILIIPILLIGAILAIIYFVFDPLGHQLTPIEPLPEVISSSPLESNELVPQATITEPMALSMRIEGTDLPAYLEALKLRKIFVSSNPEGIFINNIFYAPGDSLNPELGLVFEEVLSDGSAKQLVLVDSSNTRHFLTFQ